MGTVTDVRFSQEALEDLRAVGDSRVIAEIISIARQELRPPPSTSAIEGTVDPGPPPVWWRAAVPLAQVPAYESYDLTDDSDQASADAPGEGSGEGPGAGPGEETDEASDHRIVYRWMTGEEKARWQVETETFLVLRVLSIGGIIRQLTAPGDRP